MVPLVAPSSIEQPLGSAAVEPARLADGVELLGPYENSAYESPHYLVRRPDGQVIHLSQLLYLVLSFLQGSRDLAEVAEAMTEQLGRRVEPAHVEYLVEQKLNRLGVLALATDEDAGGPPPTSSLLLSLRYRARVIPAGFHRSVTWALQPLFWPPLVVGVVGALLAGNIWLFGTHRQALLAASRQLSYHPAIFLLVTVLVLASGFFHELGHAAGAKYGGASPGVMGVGIYLVFPAFYTDLTDAYRLNRRGRLRADLGGIYFNGVLIVLAGAIYFATGFSALLIFIVLSQAAALYQFLPFVRLDGYYIASDLIGVPNLFGFLGPALASLYRRHDPVLQRHLSVLRRRARAAIRAWAALTGAFLAFNVVTVALVLPVLLPSQWAAARSEAQAVGAGFAHGNWAGGLNGVIDLVFLAITPAGILLILVMMLRRVAAAMRRWWPGHRLAISALALAVVAGLSFQAHAVADHLGAESQTPAAAEQPRPAAGSPLPPEVSRVVPRFALAPALPEPPATVPPSPVAVPQAQVAVPQAAAPPQSTAAAPSAGGPTYVVQPGDTLWGLAAKYLGNPLRWPELFAMNEGLAQADGQALVDPDLLLVGWTLRFPPDASGLPGGASSVGGPALSSPGPVSASPATGDPAP